MVKNPKRNPAPANHETKMSPEAINEMAVGNVKTLALIAGIGYTLAKILDTTSEISIIAAKSHFK